VSAPGGCAVEAGVATLAETVVATHRPRLVAIGTVSENLTRMIDNGDPNMRGEKSSMRPQKVAVVGAAGLVGSALARHLHREGWSVIATTRNTLGAALVHASAPDCEIRVGSLTPDPGEAHLLDDCDVVLNCALTSSGGIPRQAYTANRRLVDGMLRAKSLRWLIHFSTVAVYGELIAGYEDEERGFRRPRPGSEYGRSKLDVERYALQRCRERGVQCSVLRLGHVYGAGVARSREIIELARDRHFRLPYDGRLPSNAIHIDYLTSAIHALLSADAPPGVIALAEKNGTWRDVFDWHTACLGLPSVAGMDDGASKAVRELYTGRSLPRDMVGWVRGLPIRQLVRSPTLFDVALRVLAKTPDTVTKRISDANRRLGSRAEITRSTGGGSEPLPPLYLSDGMPGPHLEMPTIPAEGAGSNAPRCRELCEWYERWSTPMIDAAAMLESASPA